MKKRKAFTLVELLLAAAIFAVVVVSIFSAFHTGIFSYRNIDDAIELYQSARRALERMNLDVRNAFSYSADDAKFTGDANSISFLTLQETFSEDEVMRDYAFVSYSLEGGRLIRLCRKGKESLNDKLAVEPDELAQGAEELVFSYGYVDKADGTLKWKDAWDDAASFPAALKVTLSLKNKANAAFERTIYLPIAG